MDEDSGHVVVVVAAAAFCAVFADGGGFAATKGGAIEICETSLKQAGTSSF